MEANTRKLILEFRKNDHLRVTIKIYASNKQRFYSTNYSSLDFKRFFETILLPIYPFLLNAGAHTHTHIYIYWTPFPSLPLDDGARA